MITFVLDIESVSADLSVGVVQDLTIYGSPNSARNTLALYLFLYKRDALSNDVAISVDNTTPLTVAQWPFTLPAADGIFIAVPMGITIWQAGTYANLAGVYYNGVYYRSNKSTSGTPGVSIDWDVVTNLSVFIGNSTVQQGQVYMFSSARSEAGSIGDSLADLGNKIIDGKCRNVDEAAAVITGAALIESAFVNFRRADYTNAQSIIDYVQRQTSLTI